MLFDSCKTGILRTNILSLSCMLFVRSRLRLAAVVGDQTSWFRSASRSRSEADRCAYISTV